MARLAGTLTANAFEGVFELGKFRGRLTGLFGQTDRVHTLPHSGTDIAARSGTECPALCAGTVEFVSLDGGGGWAEIFGNSVIVETDDARILYGHLGDAPSVVPGQTVEVGQVIGRIGSTGKSDGPHLHLGAAPLSNEWFNKDRDGGVTRLLDPMLLLGPARRVRAPSAADVRLQLADRVVEQALGLRILLAEGAPGFVVNATIDEIRSSAEALRRAPGRVR